MSALSLDYAAVLAGLRRPMDPAAVGEALLAALGDRYEAQLSGACALFEFQQAGATYLFDLASSADLPQEDRTVAAWALTPATVAARDAAYQGGYPLQPAAEDAPVDRGHVIPHLSGGEFGPNIFRQDRALNRGWSAQGERYRRLSARRPPRPAPCTSRTCSTAMTARIPRTSRPVCCAGPRCTSSASTIAPDPVADRGRCRGLPGQARARRVALRAAAREAALRWIPTSPSASPRSSTCTGSPSATRA